MEATRILAIRHGETAWNVDTRIQGHLDIPLNATGLQQARWLAQALAERDALHAIYASDLSRAHVTAQTIAEAAGLAVSTHPGLRERSFGDFQGRTFAEIEAELPEHAQQWRKRSPEWAPPGNGESLIALRERVLATVDELASRHVGEQIVLVAHKVSGILSEMLPDGSIIVGIGVNVALAEHELPTERATSLALHLLDAPMVGQTIGDARAETATQTDSETETQALMDAVLASILRELFVLLDTASSGAPGAAEQVRSMVTGDSATLGTEVVALMPSGEQVRGVAVRLAADGALVIRVADGREVVVAAGDIEHLR